MEKGYGITEYFAGVETTKEHKGYFCSVGEALTIVIIGSFCGLRNVNQIHQWATDTRVKEFLFEQFGVREIPCYYWLLCLLKMIKPESLNRCFADWVRSLLPKTLEGLTLAIDGKTICSTGRMEKNESALHIVSAHIAELKITYGQQVVYDKSNEIPAVRELIGRLDIKGCMVVADALNCQKETAKAIIEAKADYTLSVKGNQATLLEDIGTYVQDDDLREGMDSCATSEKNGGRIELRTAYATTDIDWLHGKKAWKNLVTIGAVHTQFTTSKGTSDEWHYYISSRKLTAERLLHYARSEWSVEAMHWLLDVHFREDFCRVGDDGVQQSLNMVRKIALNCVRRYKTESKVKKPLSGIMFDCLLNPQKLIPILALIQN